MCVITSKFDPVRDLAWKETLEPEDMHTCDYVKKFLTKSFFLKKHFY